MIQKIRFILLIGFLVVTHAVASLCQEESQDSAIPTWYPGFTSLDFPDFSGPQAQEPYLFESGNVKTLLNPDQKLFGTMELQTPFQRFETMSPDDWKHIQNVFRWSTEAFSKAFLYDDLSLPPAQRNRVFQLILNEHFDGKVWRVEGFIYPRLTRPDSWVKTRSETIKFLGHTFSEDSQYQDPLLPLKKEFLTPSLFQMSPVGLKTLREKLLDRENHLAAPLAQVRANGPYPHHYFSCNKCLENPKALPQDPKTHTEPILKTTFTADVKLTPHFIPYQLCGNWNSFYHTNKLGTATWRPDHHFTSFAYLPWNYLRSLAHHARAYTRTTQTLTRQELPLNIRFMFEDHFHCVRTSIPAHLEATFELLESPTLSLQGLDLAMFSSDWEKKEALQTSLNGHLKCQLSGFSLTTPNFTDLPRVPFLLLRYDQHPSEDDKNCYYGNRLRDKINHTLLGDNRRISMYVSSPMNNKLSATLELLSDTQTLFTHDGLMGRHVETLKDLSTGKTPASDIASATSNQSVPPAPSVPTPVSCESDQAFESRVYSALRAILEKAEPLQYPETPPPPSNNTQDDDDDGDEQSANAIQEDKRPYIPLILAHPDVIALILKGFGHTVLTENMKNPALFRMNPPRSTDIVLIFSPDHSQLLWQVTRSSLADTLNKPGV